MAREDWRLYAWLGSVGIIVLGYAVLAFGGARVPPLVLSAVALFAGLYSAFVVGRG